MKLDLRKTLLAGTALVAVGAFSAGAAHAADSFTETDLTANGTEDIVGDGNGDDVWLTNTDAGSTTADITIDSSAGTDTLTIRDAAADRTANIDTISFTNSTNAVLITVGDGTDNAVTLNVNGAVSGDGTSDLSFRVLADGIGTTDEATRLNFLSNVDLGGTGTISLEDDDTNNQGDAVLGFTGTSTQSVTGVINGATAGEGQITITNTGGTVTFNSNVGATAVGAIGIGGATGTSTVVFGGTVSTVNTHGESGIITIGQTDGGSATATFMSTVSGAQGIVLGTGAGTADTAIANFNTSGGSFGVTGAISAGDAADSTTVNVLGGNTLTLATAMGTNIDTVAVSGSSTLTSGQNMAATTFTVESGSTLATTGNTVTGAITNNGTLQFGGGSVAGAITGTGALDVNNNGNFNGAVTQASADIAAGATLTQITTAGGWNVTSTNFSGAGGLTLLGTSQTVAGNFTATTNGTGTITVNDVGGAQTVAFTGDIGTSTSSLAAFNFQNAGANAQTVTTTGSIFATGSLLDANDTLSFIGTSAQTVSGTIGGHGDNEGILNVGTGTSTTDVTFNGVIGTGANTLASATVAAAATARFMANAEVNGAFTNTGTSYVGVGSTLTAGSFTDTGTYFINAADADLNLTAADFGQLTDASPGSTITISRWNVNVTGNLGTGTVQVATGVTPVANGDLLDNSFQYTFTAAGVGGNTQLTVSKMTAASIGTGANGSAGNVSVGGVLDDLSASTNAQIMVINDNLAAASSEAEANEILESVQVAADGGHVVGALTVSNATLGITGQRLAMLRDGSPVTGMATGNMNEGVRMWGQVFGQTADQDRRDGIDGYEADTYGFAVGVDTENMAMNTVLGMAFSFGNTNVDSHNANSATTDVDSYQLTLYGDHDLDDRTYLSGMLAWTFADNETTRINIGGVGSGLAANGEFDSDMFTGRLELGRDYSYNEATLTPHVLAHWSHYDPDSYSETGAAGANLNVAGDNLDIFELGLGLDIGWLYQNSDGSYMEPEIRLGVRQDLADDEFQATQTFAGGGNAFKTTGLDPADTTFNAGVGLTYYSTDNWEFTANYDFEYKSDYDSHAGFVRAAYKF